MKEIVNLPNDTVAIKCEINDNKNNTYTIIPREVMLGIIDKDKDFVTEEDGTVIPPLDNIEVINDENINTYYVYPKKVYELLQEYASTSDNLNMAMYSYLKDIAGKLNIVLKSNVIKPTFLVNYLMSDNLFVCDFKNKDYFWLSELICL